MKKNNIILGYPAVSGIGLSQGKNQVLSFVNSNGEIKISSKTSKKIPNLKIPFLRGIILFFYGTFQFLCNLSQSSKYNEVEKQELKFENKISKKLNIGKASVFWSIFAFVSVFVGFFALVLVPDLIVKNFNLTQIQKNAISGTIKLTIFYATIISLKLFPSMRAYYRYNGAINSCFNEINQKAQTLTTKNTKNSSYFLTTNFLCFVIFCFAIDFFVVSLVGLNANYFLKILFNIAVFLTSTSFCYEFLKVFESRKLLLCRIIAIILCYPVVNKPTRTELEICLSGIEELNLMEKDKQRVLINIQDDEKHPLSSVLCEVKNILSSHEIDDPSEAEWLIATILEKNRTEMKLTPYITSQELQKIREALNLRIQHMPLSKIFGFAEFYGTKFIVDKNVLSPRPETELLCEQAIKHINKNNCQRCLDLCTGSGAIAVTLAKNTKCKIDASDISKSALKIATQNAKNNDVKINLFESNMFSGLKKNVKFDIIVSNPPYIATNEIALLDDEVKKYDPHLALDGGKDGLDFVRIIADNAPEFLRKDGVLMLEIGEAQSKEVKSILNKNFKNIKIVKDYNKIDRIIIATKKE